MATPKPRNQQPQRLLYTVEEVCEMLGGLSRCSYYKLRNEGELETVLIAGRRLTPRESIDKLIAKSRSK